MKEMKNKTIKAFQESGFPIDPPLPSNFNFTAHEDRPRWQIDAMWERVFIQTEENDCWPEGIRYDVRCLDGGAWDRSTNKGAFGTLEEALQRCKELCE